MVIFSHVFVIPFFRFFTDRLTGNHLSVITNPLKDGVNVVVDKCLIPVVVFRCHVCILPRF